MTSLLLIVHIIVAVATLLYGSVVSLGILFRRLERNEKRSQFFVYASLSTIVLGVALGIVADQETIALCSNIAFYTIILTVMHGVMLRFDPRTVFAIPSFSAAMVCLILLI